MAPSGRPRKRVRAWLRGHSRDHHVRRARKEGYRSRAAYKLAEIDDKTKLVSGARSLVDLGAAPGGWSQVAARRARAGCVIVAVDLQDMEPVPGVVFVKGDIRDTSLASVLMALLGPAPDLVLCDAAPDVSGVRDRDDACLCDLHDGVLGLCAGLGARALVMKTFSGGPLGHARDKARRAFAKVAVQRPKATKSHSRECYVVAKGRSSD